MGPLSRPPVCIAPACSHGPAHLRANSFADASPLVLGLRQPQDPVCSRGRQTMAP